MSCVTEILENDEPTLEAAQKAVGGYVEMLQVSGGQLLVNEEGQLKGLSHNPTASEIAGQSIVGNALFLKGSAKWK